MQPVSSGDRLHEISKLVFWGNIKEKYFNMRPAENFIQSDKYIITHRKTMRYNVLTVRSQISGNQIQVPQKSERQSCEFRAASKSANYSRVFFVFFFIWTPTPVGAIKVKGSRV